MAKIKICGLSRISDIEAVNQVSPDFIGFVFAQSKRMVTAKMAARMKSLLKPDISSVGVFVNEEIDKIIQICNQNIIDAVQLHGDEDEAYILTLRSKIHLPVIKAVRVRTRLDILNAENLPCDYLLLDSYKKDVYGGLGKVFDWSIIPDYHDRKKPIFLAGGLNINNLKNAMLNVKPYCIDISSGVETDGRKDPLKIKEVVNMIRSLSSRTDFSES